MDYSSRQGYCTMEDTPLRPRFALSLSDVCRRDLPHTHWWQLSGGVHITPVGCGRQLPEALLFPYAQILASARTSLDCHGRLLALVRGEQMHPVVHLEHLVLAPGHP